MELRRAGAGGVSERGGPRRKPAARACAKPLARKALRALVWALLHEAQPNFRFPEMTLRSRRPFGRSSLFLYYVCGAYLAVFMAAPLVRALEPAARDLQAAGRASASSGASSAP